MTPNPCTLPPDAPGFEAVLAMTHRGIHRLPVVEHGRLHGLVSSTDLLRAQGVSSVHPADRICRAGDLAELVAHAAELPDLWFNLARRSETTPVLGRIVSGIADAPVGCSPWPRCAVVRRPCLTPGSSMARLASNLFDFRVVHGDEQLGRPLRRQIARNCPRHDTLFVHLVANACSIPPPLGFFRQLVVIGEGEHEGDLEIKRHGLLPIVDLARIHALAAGVRETGTLPRLRAAAAGKLLSQDGAETLSAAFEFLLALRTRHQKEQLSQGLRADNFVAPASLSAGDRQSLRDDILSFGWVCLEGPEIRLDSARHRLVLPRRALNEASVTIHRITDDRAAAGEKLRSVLTDFLAELQDRVLIAHYSPTELRFIDTACRACFGGAFLPLVIDTLDLGRRTRVGQAPGSLRLPALRARHHLPRYAMHHAL
jgi:hypothetical protein